MCPGFVHAPSSGETRMPNQFPSREWCSANHAPGRIYTKVDLQVTESRKGKIDGAHFALVHAGGVLGQESSFTPEQEEYAVGEEVVVFLALNHRGEGVTIGLSQGKFHVAQDPITG